MADTPSAQDPLDAIKDAICQKVGFSLGAALVSMLREHAPCDCVTCQLRAIAYLCDWCVSGEDVRETLPAVDSLISALTSLRTQLAATHTFAVALDAAGVGSVQPGHA